MAGASAEQTGPGSPLWRFSVAFYRQDGVAPACLALQDGCGVDVNLLLFLLWIALSRRQIGADDLRALDARLAPWRAGVIGPLRQMRRRLKADAPLLASAPAAAFRERVKAIELESERLQQEAMHAMAATLATAPAASPAAAARANVAAYEAVKGRAFDGAAVETLLAAFGSAWQNRAGGEGDEP